MKIRSFSLLILAALLLSSFSSCIMIEQAPIGTSSSTTPATEPPTAEPTLPVTQSPIRPTLPLWKEGDDLVAANKVLTLPRGGIVDVSRQKYTYDEMVADLAALATIYPRYFSYRSIGKSVADRDIYVGILGNPDAPRQVVVSAAIHAREYMTAMLVMKEIEFCLQYYTTGSYQGIPYATLFESVCFYIVPMTNPDGVMLSQDGLDSLPVSLRQTVLDCYETEKHSYKSLDLYLSHWKANARGVDLNRNYDALWEQYNKADAPQSYQYKGPSPASEPETQAMVSLIESLPSVACVLCIHSQGEVLYWNCGQKLPERTFSFTQAVSDRNDYKIIYDQNNDASLSDWCELKKNIVSITVETGNVMCPLPIEQFSAIWLDNFDLFALTALYFF